MAKTKVAKTNAARFLDQQNIKYECLTYEVDPNDLAAEGTAAKLSLDPKQVFKTLVVRGDASNVQSSQPSKKGGNEICFAVIPANTYLDLKALAKLSQNRKVAPVPLREVQPLTGYIRGGVTALASKKPYPVYVHETILNFEQIAVSAGKRGLMLFLAPQDYVKAVFRLVFA
ncbi:MAG: Cys-tRNA(Pro) deacylase [Merismopedia sp. SIO2A8]|nr:Cys-tRNA(Pro) deacylase [Merismopedia sp. SIO2A8]